MCELTHLAACIISSPLKDGMQPHPAFFTHRFIVCLNPTQSQRQGVWMRARRESDQGGTCYYNLSSIRLHGSSGIIVLCLAWSLARLISPGETQPPTNNTKHNVDWSYMKAREVQLAAGVRKTRLTLLESWQYNNMTSYCNLKETWLCVVASFVLVKTLVKCYYIRYPL